jgi:signal transduction histidine kinase
MNAGRARLGGSWFDPALAGAFLVLCEVEAIGHSPHGLGPLAVVAALAVPLAWRRQAPLASACLVMSGTVLLLASVPGAETFVAPQLVLFLAPYAVAAGSPRRRAWLGLAACLAAVALISLLVGFEVSGLVFSVGACVASWGIGRAMRARRALAAELRASAERIAAEQGGRKLLAIAEQRTRIAYELQTLVADSVSTMIVQAQAAQRLLGQGSEDADAAMSMIEDTGRHALTEMRRILGVLRHSDDRADLAPQPGIGQIPVLVEAARRAHRSVALRVEGEPGPLPASVDLGVYRVLEDVLAGPDDDPGSVDILLRFGADDIELTVTGGAAHLNWPTVAMRERVALCHGTVDVDSVPGAGERLVARIPRVFEGSLA